MCHPYPPFSFLQSSFPLSFLVNKILFVLFLVAVEKLLLKIFGDGQNFRQFRFVSFFCVRWNFFELRMFHNFLHKQSQKAHEENVSALVISFGQIDFGLPVNLIARTVISVKIYYGKFNLR